jgi:hypothetical protein
MKISRHSFLLALISLFLWLSGSFHIHSRLFTQLTNKALRLSDEWKQRSNVYEHRKWFISSLSSRKVSPVAIQRMKGSRLYTTVDDTDYSYYIDTDDPAFSYKLNKFSDQFAYLNRAMDNFEYRKKFNFSHTIDPLTKNYRYSCNRNGFDIQVLRDKETEYIPMLRQIFGYEELNQFGRCFLVCGFYNYHDMEVMQRRQDLFVSHEQWIRRTHLMNVIGRTPDIRSSQVLITNEYTLLEYSLMNPIGQVMVVHADSLDDIQDYLKIEPFYQGEVVPTWTVLEMRKQDFRYHGENLLEGNLLGPYLMLAINRPAKAFPGSQGTDENSDIPKDPTKEVVSGLAPLTEEHQLKESLRKNIVADPYQHLYDVNHDQIERSITGQIKQILDAHRRFSVDSNGASSEYDMNILYHNETRFVNYYTLHDLNVDDPAVIAERRPYPEFNPDKINDAHFRRVARIQAKKDEWFQLQKAGWNHSETGSEERPLHKPIIPYSQARSNLNLLEEIEGEGLADEGRSTQECLRTKPWTPDEEDYPKDEIGVFAVVNGWSNRDILQFLSNDSYVKYLCNGTSNELKSGNLTLLLDRNMPIYHEIVNNTEKILVSNTISSAFRRPIILVYRFPCYR